MGKDVEPKLYTEAEVKALLPPLLEKIEGLKLRIAKMQRDSSTSSKPPSSDIIKPPKGGVGGGGPSKKLKPGGQPGHPKHQRRLFDPGDIDRRMSAKLTRPCF